MYLLRGITVLTMGYSIDSLDVYFGDQLVGSAHHYKKRHIRDILGRTIFFSVIHMTLL